MQTCSRTCSRRFKDKERYLISTRTVHPPPQTHLDWSRPVHLFSFWSLTHTHTHAMSVTSLTRIGYRTEAISHTQQQQHTHFLAKSRVKERFVDGRSDEAQNGLCVLDVSETGRRIISQSIQPSLGTIHDDLKLTNHYGVNYNNNKKKRKQNKRN